MNLLCKVGIHKWLHIGWVSLVLPGMLYECLRCHRREARYITGTVWSAAPEGGWTDYLELQTQPTAKLAAGEQEPSDGR